MFFLITKKCSRCKTIKIITNFSKNKAKKDGLQNSCKNCRSIEQSFYKYSEKTFEKRKKHRKTKKYKKTQKETVARYKKKNPEKVKAHSVIQKAIQRKILERPFFCSLCGITKDIHGYHEDYALLLDVIWLCRFCHIKIHETMKGDMNGI